MSITASTNYQGLLQRMQSFVSGGPTHGATLPGVPAQPLVSSPVFVQPAVGSPVMGADTFVRTSGGFAMPAAGSFLPGHAGPMVATLQAHLGALGYLAGTPDQLYANGTIEAVKYFQMDYGLPPNGLFDLAAHQTMMAVFAGQLPWKRAPLAQNPAAQPAAAVPGNPLGLEWPAAAQPAPQQAVQNPLGVDWVTAPKPAAQPPAAQAPAAQPAAPKPETKPESKPEPKPESKPAPKPAVSANQAANDALARLTPDQLTKLGATDKKGFFAILRPAAEESERQHGVPAAVTMAQAALETGWGKHIIPGYNIFGIKGKGPAGTVAKQTWEHYNGKDVTITANFAKYHNFYEAVSEHGKRFHNGYYDKAIAVFKTNPDPFLFAQNITGIYATDPNYGKKLGSIMREYGLA